MKQVKWLVAVMVVLGLALAFVGCSKPPEAEQKAAKEAMDAATSAGADKFAKSDFEAAKKAWDGAEAQVKDKKYKEAKQAYVDAKAAFEKATAGVEAGKKAMAEEVGKNVAALEESWTKLDAEAKKLEKKMKDKKEAWTADAKTISEGLAKAKETAATDAAAAQAKLDEIKGMIEKWDGAFKEMAAAPPAKPEPAKKK
ncbi:MAG: DUF4398 domain-containing protein [Deltaproteobacteria bacterium]|nr:MAG: DUF4398 domain-containing protein [Deltaproteobacteria bacterium]